jgi:hypothetical protein
MRSRAHRLLAAPEDLHAGLLVRPAAAQNLHPAAERLSCTFRREAGGVIGSTKGKQDLAGILRDAPG